MAPSLSLRVALYLLVLDGLAALYLGEFLGPHGLVLVLLLLVATWLAQARVLAAPGGRPRGAGLLVPLAALGSLADIAYVAENVLDALVRLLLFLVLYKLAVLRTVPETRAITFLAFFMLVSASTSAFGVGFLFVFVIFVGLVSGVTLLQHVQGEAGRRAAASVEPIPARELVGLAAVGAVAVFGVAAGLFFLLPRVGLAALPLRAGLGQMITGFSERVELGAYGSILTNSGVVMRVRLPEEPDPQALEGLRWRGIVLDTFDGRVWSVRYPRRTRLLRSSGGGFEVGVLERSGRLVRQEIFLEPIGSEVLFAAGHVLRMTLPTGLLVVDDMGAVSAPAPGARLRYMVESELEGPLVPGRWTGRLQPPLDPAALERYLQLPALAPAIAALARQVAAGSQDPWQIAARVQRFLLRGFRYTLDIQRVSDLEPLEEFLLVRRAGNCEYFAASMAVMLRSLGVPARVVNGFQRGEWNPYGQYFIVRYADAHSWVEAYMPGAGWVTFDPTPRAAGDVLAGRAPLLLYLDSLRLQWHRYVVNWSLRDQVRAVRAMHVRLATLRTWPTSLDPETRARLARIGVMLAVAIVGLAGGALWWWGRGPLGRSRGDRVPAFYRRALQRLARRGLRPAPGETAREFGDRVTVLGPPAAEAFARLTTLYERARFGGAGPTAADLGEAEACVGRLEPGERP
jgi:transglutaminase-like putative cysteine protease